MLVKQAKAIARQWVKENASTMSGFQGAFFHGSTNWLADSAELAPTSDLDVMLVFDEPPPVKLGKFIYQDLLLEISYLAAAEVATPAQVLSVAHMAGSFKEPSIILDPTGHLTKIQKAVAQEYAQRRWVIKRCQFSREKIISGLQSLDATRPWYGNIMGWVFATGITTHVLLVAGLKNPTVRKRYVAARELLAEYDRLDFHERLLALLGCAQMSAEQVAAHVPALAQAFDAAAALVKTPILFASDISPAARSISIDGALEQIAHGLHREAIFWMVVTYTRCLHFLTQDAPAELLARHTPGFDALLADLGIDEFADLVRRRERVMAFLPELWAVAAEIIDANPNIQIAEDATDAQ